MKKINKHVVCGIGAALILSLFGACATGSGNTLQQGTSNLALAPKLGVAENFAIFGSAGVSSQGLLTIVKGDLGANGASTLITGLHDKAQNFGETALNIGNVEGGIYTDWPQGNLTSLTVSLAVLKDSQAAYKGLAAQPNGIDPGASQLGGLSLTPGVYKASKGSFQITDSDLVLDAQGNPDAVWIFQMNDSLIVGARLDSRSIILVNGGQAGNVYWQVGKTAVINPHGGGLMVGTIIAHDSINISTPGNTIIAQVFGRAISLSSVVNVANTTIAIKSLVAVPVGPNIVVTGTSASDVETELKGNGFINVKNNGGHVSVTEIGNSVVTVVNNGAAMSVLNTGNGTVTITSTATGLVNIVNKGNGRVTITATGAAPIGINHIGDEDFTYP